MQIRNRMEHPKHHQHKNGYGLHSSRTSLKKKLRIRDLLESTMTLFKIKEIHHHSVLVLAKNIEDVAVSCCDDYGIDFLVVSATLQRLPTIGYQGFFGFFDTSVSVSLHCVNNYRCKVLVVKPVEDNLVKIDDE